MKWAPIVAGVVACVIVVLLIWQPFDKIAQNDEGVSPSRPYVAQDDTEPSSGFVVEASPEFATKRSVEPELVPVSPSKTTPSPPAKTQAFASRSGKRQGEVFDVADRFAAAQNLDEKTADQLRTLLLSEDADLVGVRDAKRRSAVRKETDKMARSLLTNRQFDAYQKIRSNERTRPKQVFRPVSP